LILAEMLGSWRDERLFSKGRWRFDNASEAQPALDFAPIGPARNGRDAPQTA